MFSHLPCTFGKVKVFYCYLCRKTHGHTINWNYFQRDRQTKCRRHKDAFSCEIYINQTFYFSKYNINLRYYELILRIVYYLVVLIQTAADKYLSLFPWLFADVPATSRANAFQMETFSSVQCDVKWATSTCQTSTSTTVYNRVFPPHQTLSHSAVVQRNKTYKGRTHWQLPLPHPLVERQLTQPQQQTKKTKAVCGAA